MNLLDDEDEITRAKRSISWVRLEDTLKQKGCPVCNLMTRSLEKYFEHLLYEYVLDVDVRKKLHASLGFCTHHAWLLKETEHKSASDGLDIATLYETVIQDELRRLKEAQATKRIVKRKPKKLRLSRNSEQDPLAHKILKRLTPTGECLGCFHQRISEEFYLHELLRFWKDVEFRTLFEQENVVLCRPHFLALLKETNDADVIDYFVNVQINKLEKLSFRLSEFCRKHDYRFQHELTEEEHSSWLEVLEHFSSKKNIIRLWNVERRFDTKL